MQDVYDLFSKSNLTSANNITSVTQLAGDASSKIFYRIKLKDYKQKSLVLIKLSQSKGPLSSGKSINQDQSFIEIGQFLDQQHLPVPKIYFFDLDLGFAVIEDLGDHLLADFLKEQIEPEVKYSLFKQTLDLIPKIQELPQNPDSIIFNRNITYENYLEESLRFVSFYLPLVEIKKSEIEVIESCIKSICQQVADQAQVPIYRDLMAWNIMIDKEEIRLVDFQDMIIGAHAYDLCSLLHDRDTDLKLGANLLEKLVVNYVDSNNLSPDFINDYYYCLLQRNFRLAGQFLNLSKITNKEVYKNWVPGCMYRLGKTLVNFPDFSDSTQILANISNEFKSGLASVS